VSVPPSVLLGPDDPAERAARLTYPVVVKPAWEGSSKGIRNRCLVQSAKDLPAVIEGLRRDHRQPILVEEYIAGDEITVGIYGNETPRILGIMRVVPQFPAEHFIYSLEIKREYKKMVTYECPAALPEATLTAIRSAALASWHALGCRDVSRVDFRVRGGVPYFLEVNPLPGLNPDDSDLVIMAGLVGWSYERLVTTIVNAALERTGLR
jgi:D-alanine-D-alanine ligase